MDAIFGELTKLPCHYCIYSGSCNSRCISRAIEVSTDGTHEICDQMVLNMDILMDSIKWYFEFKHK